MADNLWINNRRKLRIGRWYNSDSGVDPGEETHFSWDFRLGLCISRLLSPIYGRWNGRYLCFILFLSQSCSACTVCLYTRQARNIYSANRIVATITLINLPWVYVIPHYPCRHYSFLWVLRIFRP
ncbi:hypothetical protein BEWA_054880 [Theileria equi strain WA]|uniref:Uncharacterized protein n=1 Tax=Theileria equi strain WA TaxID=1537102 RepID=L1LDK3_THEEQ|nr:hypothetical protein BEWA_054880 [Theileria equi strain WA]EKX73431.1 hypothetical protein BEWA_054880 [Theileria equi strain WA]|eukprot:XP_004832883.1 hypothetical protein BEWA_054880 [Theileria equi strain WA]